MWFFRTTVFVIKSVVYHRRRHFHDVSWVPQYQLYLSNMTKIPPLDVPIPKRGERFQIYFNQPKTLTNVKPRSHDLKAPTQGGQNSPRRPVWLTVCVRPCWAASIFPFSAGRKDDPANGRSSATPLRHIPSPSGRRRLT